MNLQPCDCGGVPDLHGGTATSRHWVTCRVCGADTGLCRNIFDAFQAWNARKLKVPARPITPPAEVDALRAEVERLREALARIQILSHQAWCDLQGRLQDAEHKRAHDVLARINADASTALAPQQKEPTP